MISKGIFGLFAAATLAEMAMSFFGGGPVHQVVQIFGGQ